MATERQRLTADDDPHRDHQEAGGRRPSGRAHVVGQLRLDHPDHQPTEQRQREGAESPDHRRRQSGDDEQGGVLRAQRDDRGDERSDDTRERRADRPVDQRHPVGRDPERAGGELVLGHRRGGQAEPGEPVGRPQQRGQRDGDPEQDEPIHPDGRPAADRHDPVGQEGRDEHRVAAVTQEPDLDQDREHPGCRNHTRQRRGPPQRTHHGELDRGAEGRAHHAGGDQRRHPPPPVVGGQLVEEVTANRRDRSLGKVDHPGRAVDQDDPLPE